MELISAAVVYAPTSQFLLNAIYQRVRLPSEVDVFGGGLSAGFNIGGKDSGVDSWARLGLEVAMLGRRPQSTGKVAMEWRAAAQLRARAFGDSFATVSLGPRFTSQGDKPALLATLGFTYDVDRLIVTDGPILPAD